MTHLHMIKEEGYKKFEIAIGEYYCITDSKNTNLFQIQKDMPDAVELFQNAVVVLIRDEVN